MQWDDDGERELDDLVSTWSLGAPAHMEFRIKKSHAHPNIGETSYNPNDEVVMGSDFWEGAPGGGLHGIPEDGCKCNLFDQSF